MAVLDLTSFDAALKDYYTAQQIKMLAYKRNPFLALVNKMERFGGRKLPIPIVYGLPKGRSATFSQALTAKAGGDYEAFEITRVKDYGVIEIDAETMEASEGDTAAWMDARTVEVDGIIRAVANSLGGALFRNATGSIARLSNSGFATTVATLTERSDVQFFEKGQQVVFSAADGGALRDAGDFLTVNAVDRSAGTVTFDANLSNIAAIAQNDYMYIRGDAANGSTNLKVSGLDAWLPTTAPGATLFFGVNRSLDTDRLGGIRVSATGATIEEAVIECSARLNEAGGEPDLIIMNPLDLGDFVKSLGTKARYDMVKSPDMAAVGFRGVSVTGVDGDMPIVGDRGCPRSRFYMLTRDSWKLYSLGQAPKVLNLDGLRWLRSSTADSYELRSGYYAQLGCNAPGYNAVCTF